MNTSSNGTSDTGTSTRQRIRRTAAELFGQRGYGGTSIAALAQQLGLSKAALYNYYGSKEELLMELLEDSLIAWRDASGESLDDASGGYAERLRQHMDAALCFTRERPHEVAVLRVAATQLTGDLGVRVRTWLDGQKQDHEAQLIAFFEAAVAAGELPQGDNVDRSLLFRALIDGILINIVFGDPETSRMFLRRDALWRQLWLGLGGEIAE